MKMIIYVLITPWVALRVVLLLGSTWLDHPSVFFTGSVVEVNTSHICGPFVSTSFLDKYYGLSHVINIRTRSDVT